MITKIDASIHLPDVYAGPWTHFPGRYERRVTFNCNHGYRYAVLKVCGNGEGTPLITVTIDGVAREMTVGEHVDPFSTANEMLVSFSHNCGCCTGVDWGVQ